MSVCLFVFGCFCCCFFTDITNNLLVIEVEVESSLNNATVNCTFLYEFNGSARCRVQYGTDPTYKNLPYFAESTETGTAGHSVSVVLREQLNLSTVYYYTVSAVSGDVTVRVLGTFSTPQNSMYIPCVYSAADYPLSSKEGDTK